MSSAVLGRYGHMPSAGPLRITSSPLIACPYHMLVTASHPMEKFPAILPILKSIILKSVNSLAPSSHTSEPSCDREISDAKSLSVDGATPEDSESASAIDCAHQVYIRRTQPTR